MADANLTTMARATGYVVPLGNGERIQFAAFKAALLKARGVSITRTKRPPGRQPTHKTKVLFNGSLCVGAPYLKASGFNPGDQFEIVASHKGIRLNPVVGSPEP
jgi:hypothetical protein